MEAFCSGTQHLAGTGLCRDEGLPAGEEHYLATLRVHSLGLSSLFVQKNFQDNPKYLATILFECLEMEKRILDAAAEEQVR